MSNKLGPRTFGKREEMVFLGKEINEQRETLGRRIQMMTIVQQILMMAHSTSDEHDREHWADMLNRQEQRMKIVNNKK